MVKIYVQFPDDLREHAEVVARQRGLTFDEFVRQCVSTSVERFRVTDPLFADTEVFKSDAPADLAENHDQYFYENG